MHDWKSYWFMIAGAQGLLLSIGLAVRSAYLFSPIQKAMDSQGYPGWRTCLTEHFVRAGEVIIARRMGRITAADDLLNHYVKDRKFIYLPKIIPVLEAHIKINKENSYYEALVKAVEGL